MQSLNLSCLKYKGISSYVSKLSDCIGPENIYSLVIAQMTTVHASLISFSLLKIINMWYSKLQNKKDYSIYLQESINLILIFMYFLLSSFCNRYNPIYISLSIL